MINKQFRKIVSLVVSMLLSISWGIYPQSQVDHADVTYFENKTIEDSNPESKINEESATDSAIQVLNLDERSASSVQAGAFTISGENLTEGTDYSFTGTSGVLTIISSTPMTIQNTNPSAATNDRIEINSEANLTLAGVNIVRLNTGPAMKIADNATFDVNINLADGSENTLTTTAGNSAGLQKNSDASSGTLTIGGSGILNATGGANGAGIGGGRSESTSNITISGGTVTATARDYAAGIGGGYMGSASNITISGGQVEATGGFCGTGIGGGYMGSASNITISGGRVTAIGGEFAAGIGSGINESASYIIISDGTVTATGGTYASGIGGGYGGNGDNITISGGTVTAIGSRTDLSGNVGAGAGIGGGFGGNGDNITISGGIVTAIGGNGESGEYYGQVIDATPAAAIGGGGGAFMDGRLAIEPGTGSGNHLINNVILNAIGGGVTKDLEIETLQGFDETSGGSIEQGIVFEKRTDSEENVGTVYGEMTLMHDLTMPQGSTLTVPQSNSLTIDTNKTLNIPNDTIFKNEGTLIENGTIACQGTGKVMTEVVYNTESDMRNLDREEKIYRDASGIRSYETLPTPTKEGYYFDGWYTEESGGTQINENSLVMPNEHNLYAHWQDTPMPTPVPTPVPDPYGGNDGGFSWNVAGNDDASSSSNPTPTPTDQIGTIGTKTLKDIQSQLPDKVKVVGYIEGYDDGTFKPEKNITRAEAAQMLFKLIYNGTRVNYDALQKFSDTNQTAWYSTALAYLTEQGLIDGDGGKFYPNRQITRAEMSKILYNALLKYDKDQDKKLAYGATQFNFTDVSNNWMLEPIKYLATNDMIDGYGDGTFKPNNNITRAESVAMISKVFDRSQTFSQRVSFKDVSQSHWAYKYIMNAVNGEN